MAKGDVTMQFDANTAAAVQKMLALREHILSTANATRQLGDSSNHADKGFHKMTEGATELAIKLTGISSGMSIVEKGVELFGETFERYMEKSKERAEELLHKVLNLNSALAVGGQGKEAVEVRKELEEMGGESHTIGGRVVNPEQANAIFNAVSRSLGSKATKEQKLGATEQGLKAIADNMSLEDAQAYATTYANLSRYGVQDQAYRVFTGLGGAPTDREMTGLARSKNKSEYLDVLIAARQGDEQSRALLSLQKTAEEEISNDELHELSRKLIHHPKKMTEEDRRKMRVGAIQAQGGDVFHEALNDPTLVPGSDRMVLNHLRQSLKNLPNLPTSIDQDILDQQRNADRVMQDTFATRDAEAMNKRTDEQGAEEQLHRTAQYQIYRARVREQARDYVDSPLPLAPMAPDEGNVNGLGVGFGGMTVTRIPAVSSASDHPVVKAINEQTEAMKKQHEEAASLSRTRRDTTLSNHKEGQQ